MMAEAVHFAVSTGISLRADRHGPADGAPVLLLHGSGQTRWSWEGTARSIGGQHGSRLAAYAVDLRGHGESGWCPDGNYRIDAFADDNVYQPHISKLKFFRQTKIPVTFATGIDLHL